MGFTLRLCSWYGQLWLPVTMRTHPRPVNGTAPITWGTRPPSLTHPIHCSLLSRRCCSPATGPPSGPVSAARGRTDTVESRLSLDRETLVATTGFIPKCSAQAQPCPDTCQRNACGLELRSIHSEPPLAGANRRMPQSLVRPGSFSSSKVKAAGLLGLQAGPQLRGWPAGLGHPARGQIWPPPGRS